MYRNHESISETQKQEETRHIIEYPGLVDTVQLSAARLLDLQGSLEADSFEAFIGTQEEDSHEQIMHAIGERFDDSLISFVTAVLIGRRNQKVIILANNEDGFNGHLPWQPKLEQHVRKLQVHKILPEAQLHVERYSSEVESVESLTEQAQSFALETSSIFNRA